ncbi:hypothetical protein FRC14_005487 [Serendipita sp. 396]|nr:hypothetical protein FRC14_005487 [Serendipita sp. 396]KAG8779974.1 hypothetical protein FRC15_009812 [Serendipita sp. 397]KAG8796979.1 hypothetical protein FRC16_009313 [Serendipita sp. 398]KAG8820370.1 hypothetical protein FRC19_008932 [Serendipita sp. 401]KAG8848318.1 hypothetical protein FRB91_010937 [Serendipita sp. 411]KAG9041057.1 hypothetical protein FS842_002734 [Serendipita sp. 407]
MPWTSTAFPPGYGDFVLQSSDGQNFYFPRSILNRMSGFFRNLDATGTEEKPFRLLEGSFVLFYLLKHMDPQKSNSITRGSCGVDVIRAGAKYQIEIILQRFQNGVDKGGQGARASVMRNNPAELLQVALDYNVGGIGRRAVQELTSRSAVDLNKLKKKIPSTVFEYIKRLRRDRRRKYWSYVDILSKLDARVNSQLGIGDGPQSRRSTRTSTVMCMSCVSSLSQWILLLEQGLQLEPSWNRFKKGFHENMPDGCQKCGRGNIVLKETADVFLTRWEIEATKFEKDQPSWPII